MRQSMKNSSSILQYIKRSNFLLCYCLWNGFLLMKIESNPLAAPISASCALPLCLPISAPIARESGNNSTFVYRGMRRGLRMPRVELLSAASLCSAATCLFLIKG